MRSIRYLGGVVLREEDAAEPRPSPKELLIRVHAVGVTPSELLWYPTLHTKDGEVRSNATPGHEFSGVVAAAGEDVARADFKVGDEVFGLNDWFSEGATAEYCLALPASIAHKPRSLSHVEAATVPIGALTAWQGWVGRAKVQAGERVFVQGGAGGVGMFAVQVAHSLGVRVTATAAPRNFDFVRQLGAEEVIDYHGEYFGENAGNFDVVFDAVGGETLEKSWSLLKPGGRMVTVAASDEQQADERVKRAFFIVEPNGRELNNISQTFDAGGLQTAVDAVVPLAQAADAYTGKLATKLGRGKVVITLTA